MAIDVASTRIRRGTFLLAASVITLVPLGIVAHLLQEPAIVPSIGPTIFLIYYAALSRGSAPRNVVGGQMIALVCGYLALLALGLGAVAPDVSDLSWRAMWSAVVALAATSAIMVWTGFVHVPATATTLIVALGLVRGPHSLAFILLAVLITVAIGLGVNRAVGVPYPLWRPVAS